MSGFRGTIGNPERDLVAAWIYDHMERTKMDERERGRIFNFVKKIEAKRNELVKIETKWFRENMAKFVRTEDLDHIRKTWGETPLGLRLMNIAIRNYRMAIDIRPK